MGAKRQVSVWEISVYAFSSPDRTIRITVPAHKPVKRSTLSHILKQAEVSLDDFLAAL
jgi:hypothetical protein